MAKTALSSSGQAPRPMRPGVALLLALLAAGSMLTLVERFRPELVEPARRRISVGLSGYFQPLLESTKEGRRVTRRIRELWGVEGEYRRLEQELARTRLELQLAREQLRTVGRISGLRRWRGPAELEFVLADVIGFSVAGSSAEWVINKGASHGLEVGLPVVGQNGLAGVIREVSDRSSRVQALTDPLSAVGVAEAESRSRGIVFGAGRDMALEFVPENESSPIVPGTELVTSGFANSVYPKGIVVGRIKAKRNNFRGAAYGVVEPAESFNSLEEVLVITRAPEFGTGDPLEGLGHYSFRMDGGDEATTPTLGGEAASPAGTDLGNEAEGTGAGPGAGASGSTAAEGGA